jgi:hypothetical protein
MIWPLPKSQQRLDKESKMFFTQLLKTSTFQINLKLKDNPRLPQGHRTNKENTRRVKLREKILKYKVKIVSYPFLEDSTRSLFFNLRKRREISLVVTFEQLRQKSGRFKILTPYQNNSFSILFFGLELFF